MPLFSPPVINSFEPAAASTGASVILTGTNFSAVASENAVYFGGARAAVQSASASALTVTVPPGAIYAPITVTVRGLTAWANAPFLPTFSGTGLPIAAENFSARNDLPAPGEGGFQVLMADIDGDGRPDLVTDNGRTHTLSIYRNISTNSTLSAGSFGPRVDLLLGTGAENAMVVADIDGDGKLDLICMDRNANEIVIVRNLCSPGTIDTNSFAAPVRLPAGGDPRDFAVRDLDGDGRPEIVVADWADGAVAILHNQSTPGAIDTNSFAPFIELPVGHGVQNVAVGDLDGNGWPDIVAVGEESGSMSIYCNLGATNNFGTNSFAARVDVPSRSSCHAVVLGDVDGDGKLDVLVTSFLESTLSVYRNQLGSGAFDSNALASPVEFPLGGWGHTVSLADLNGDGKPDVLVVTESGNQLLLYQNQSTAGSFTNSSLAAPVLLGTGANPWGVLAGDLNGDGIPDVVLANDYESSISIYRNYGEPMTAPEIVSEPTNTTAQAGTSASFSVVASGIGPLTYQWLKNGTALTNSDRIAGAQAASLTLSRVFVDASAAYSVVVANDFGSVTSRLATLQVTCTNSSLKAMAAPVIASPRPNQRSTNNIWIVNGTAGARSGVVGVWYRLNTGEWTVARGTTNWSASLQVTERTNVVRVVAVDANGNLSEVSSVRFFWTPMVPLAVSHSGEGSVSPDYNSQSLEVGKTYSITARPAAGWVFSHWEGQGIYTNFKTLRFVMQQGLALEAVFTPDPWLSLKGSYNGLLCDYSQTLLQSFGRVSLNVSDGGALSGYIQNGSVRYPLSGRFDGMGRISLSFQRTNHSYVNIGLWTNSDASIGGSLSIDDWLAWFIARRAVFDAHKNPAPQAGRYTFAIAGYYNDSTAPCGQSFGTVTIDKNGKLTMAGTLADGTPVTQSTLLTADASLEDGGNWALYVPLYSGRGALLSHVCVSETSVDGNPTWIRPSLPGKRLLPDGFSRRTTLHGAPYVAPGRNTNVLSFTDGRLLLKTADGADGTRQPVRLDPNNKMSFLQMNGSLTFSASSGRFSGRVTDPNTLEQVSVQGVVLQDSNIGCGYFLRAATTGGLLFGPASQPCPNWLGQYGWDVFDSGDL